MSQEIILFGRYSCPFDNIMSNLASLNSNPETLPAYILSRLQWGLHDPTGFRIIHNTDADARSAGL